MKNYNTLWRTYVFIVFVSITITFAIAVLIWSDVKSETRAELKYANSLVSSSVQLLLDNYEAVLKILGERLIEIGPEQNSQEARNLINSMLQDHQELAGFGLATPAGQLILTSSNIDRNKLPNLLQKPETAKTFKQALASQALVMGRTYYMKALKEWVIPLRYRITNNNGKPIAVMTAGLKLNSTHSLWSHSNLPGNVRLIIISSNYYRQLVTGISKSDYPDWYNKPVDKNIVDNFKRALLAQTHIDADALLQGGIILPVIAKNKTGATTLATIGYIPKYHFYVLTSLPLTILYKKMYTPVGWLLFLLLLVNAALFLLFRFNVRTQNTSKRNLEFQAKHDDLTKMPNRRFLFDEFETWLSKNKHRCNILYIDLDNFKSSNDLHGHSIGDRILCEVAARINKFFDQCLRVRQGGDEFIILTGDVAENELLHLCQKFITVLKEKIVVGDLEFSIGASIGIARAPTDGSTLDTLLRKADMAMYEAKRQNITAYIYSDNLEETNERRAKIEHALNSALAQNEFSLVYQPQFDARNNMIGVEALLRWHSASLGTIPPDEFIPVAEATGLIDSIGEYVFITAIGEFTDICTALSENSNSRIRAHEPLRLSINVSVHQLLSNNFLDTLKSLASSDICQNANLMIEVTESLFIEEVDRARDLLCDVQALGIAISLDDFGTGYSSLSILSKLPINELKIDKSFVRDIQADRQDRLLIQSIISIGRSLGIPVLAEGIETEEQADMLYQYGCDCFQGYYFARPMNKTKLLTYLSSSLH